MTLAVVLVEPAGPLNIGSVARLCANFGVEDLRLVAPRCDPSGQDAQRMAVHGGQVLSRARRFLTLPEALADILREGVEPTIRWYEYYQTILRRL